MAGLTFKGGIKPFDGKDITKNKPIAEADPIDIMVYPLSQHVGAPAVPIVNVGERVLGNQKIAEADGFVSANIYSAVSGMVVAIEPRQIADGSVDTCIVIQNDYSFQTAPRIPVKPITVMTQEEVIAIIREAGIIGMGGSGFPTHVKLTLKFPSHIHYVIANCAESEPYLTADYRRLIEEPEKVVAGLKIVLCLFEHARGILAIEDNKPDAIRVLKELTIDEPRISVKVLKSKYPQGSERQLIYATTHRAISQSIHPEDAGCIVDNVETLIAIYHAVIEGLPLTERVITVTGDDVRFPQNYKVKLGTSLAHLIDHAGGFKDSTPEKIITGGPMMGSPVYDLNAPVTKKMSGLICFKRDEEKLNKPSNCINCGACLNACPSRLIPSRLARFAVNDNRDKFVKYNGLECVECGSCSYVCPAKRDLTQPIKQMRRRILNDQ